MKGFVPTPECVVDLMVEKLFRDRPPAAHSRVLDPGCGRGAFLDGILRWCARHGLPLPSLVGVESNPEHVAHLRERFAGMESVEIREADFLLASPSQFDYVIGNPPYVAITSLSHGERQQYRQRYQTASGRFDLYLLFFEQAVRMLAPGGRLVFITPEKYLYVESASPLRRVLSGCAVDELHFLGEDTFANRVTYPLVSTITNAPSLARTRVVERGGTDRLVNAIGGRASWLPAIRNARAPASTVTLHDVAVRISCGVATGADPVFVVDNAGLPPELMTFAHPTISGRELNGSALPVPARSLLIPYDSSGHLLPEAVLGGLGTYLSNPERKARLLARTCVRSKPWYAFHETPPLPCIQRPKVLCKDICATPVFVIDDEGAIVPRHSVYYIVPRDPAQVKELAEYLNSDTAAQWLRDHCQRAAKGYLRLQSHVLKRLPLPTSLGAPRSQLELTGMEPGARPA